MMIMLILVTMVMRMFMVCAYLDVSLFLFHCVHYN